MFSGNFGEQTTTAKILCSFCFHSKLSIATFIACNSLWKMNSRNFFENHFSQHLMSATFCIKVARKISQVSQLFLPQQFLSIKYFCCDSFMKPSIFRTVQLCSILQNSVEEHNWRQVYFINTFDAPFTPLRKEIWKGWNQIKTSFGIRMWFLKQIVWVL